MLQIISGLNRFRPLLSRNKLPFSNEKNKRYKIVDSPSEVSKLIFDENGLCKIYEYQSGEQNLRKLVRYITALTVLNGGMFGMESFVPSTMNIK